VHLPVTAAATLLTFALFFGGVAATIYFITRPSTGRAPTP